MLYINKNTKELVELLSSGENYCLVVKYSDELDIVFPDDDTTKTIGEGVVLQCSKKEFRKLHKKAKKSIQSKLEPDLKRKIVETFNKQKDELLKDPIDFIIKQNKKIYKDKVD